MKDKIDYYIGNAIITILYIFSLIYGMENIRRITKIIDRKYKEKGG